MKKTVFLKSTLRQFVRSLFILLLVGVISFAFVARVGEYSLITREQELLISYYRSIGALVQNGPDRYGYDWAAIPKQVIELLEQSPYVAYVDQRKYTLGVLQGGLYNTDTYGAFASAFGEDGWADAGANHTDVIFYGTYVGKEYQTRQEAQKGDYRFRVDEVLSGYPEYLTSGEPIYLYVEDWVTFDDTYTQLKTGQRYLLRGYKEYFTKKIFWKPVANDLPWLVPAESDLDLSLPEYAQFASELKQSHDNACTLEITATVDMSAMPRFQPGYIGSIGEYQERYYLVDGRWLNYEDHLKGKRVIVIFGGLAETRGLKVGDSITLQMRDLSSRDINGSYYRPPYQYRLRPIGQEEPERTQTETFEIVGIYEDLTYGNIGTTHTQRPVYIPLSLYPESFAPSVPDGGDSGVTRICSLVLTSAEYEEAFQDAVRDGLAANGFYITFQENGYQNFKNATEGIGTAAKSNVAIFAVILAVCFCLAVFVYFRFRRKDLAISRALGVPAGQCVIGSALPLALVGGIGIVAGSALAWSYTQSNAETLLSALVEAAEAEGATATLPMNTLVILCLTLIAALLVLSLVFATVTVKKPVLSQLQGGRNKK